LTRSDPPGEATHWTGAAMAEATGISVSSVQRIWRAHGLHPHRVRQFKLSTDPDFVPKLRDIVGLYVDPPAHAIVLSVDEKSQTIVDLQAAINRFLREINDDPKPFIWTADPDKIIAAVKREHQVLDSIH
jgi:hypothetical protein